MLKPEPRTADRYTVDSKCELAVHNLTIDPGQFWRVSFLELAGVGQLKNIGRGVLFIDGPLRLGVKWWHAEGFLAR